MATINRKLQLRDVQGNLVFPRASLDNIQRSKDDGRDALIVTLDSGGHIDSAILPGSANAVEMLLTISTASPVGAVIGDKYYNITQNKVYTYSGSSWGNAETPSADKLYLTKDNNNIYRYESTGMVDVSTHFDVLQSVANDPADAVSTGVPSEFAVSVALLKKQDKLQGNAPIDIDGSGYVSLRYSTGLVVNSGSLEVPQNYITHTVDSLMMRDAGPASPETAYIDGGTIYTLLGNYDVTDTVSVEGSSDTKVVTEKAVRDAINAYVATGGSAIVAGQAINVDGGMISVTAAKSEQVLGSTIEVGDTSTSVVAVEQNDLSVVTPGNLRSAMSLAQAVDVSCAPRRTAGFDRISFDGGLTWVTMDNTTLKDGTIDPNLFLGNFSVKTSSSVAANTVHQFGFTRTTDTINGVVMNNRFPKRAPGLKYLMLCDVRNVTTAALNSADDHGFVIVERDEQDPPSSIQISGITNSFPVTASQSVYSRVAVIVDGDDKYAATTLKCSRQTAGTIQLDIKNWRQYEVTALTDDAIRYIASLPEPDMFFRDANARNINGRYFVKQDMVSPWMPVISMPTNSDLTVGAGLAYDISFTDSSPHKITVDAIPSNAYGFDAHIRMFVKDTASAVFVPPLNLISPLTPNAGHNLTVKFRSGQANVYIDDTDIGYVITVNSGTDNGSLDYALQYVSGYAVFAQSTDGSDIIPGRSQYLNSAMTIIGNGTDATKVVFPTDSIPVLRGKIAMSNMTVNCAFMNVDRLSNVVIDGATSYKAGSYSTILYGNGVVDGCTISNTNIGPDIAWGSVYVTTVKNSVFENAHGPNVFFVGNHTLDHCVFRSIKAGNVAAYVSQYGGVNRSSNVTGCTFYGDTPLASSATVFNQYYSTASEKAVITASDIYVDGVATCLYQQNSTASFSLSGDNIINNSKLYMKSTLSIANGSVTAETGKYCVINCSGVPAGSSCVNITNSSITGCTISTHSGSNSFINATNSVIRDCVITGNTATSNAAIIQVNGNLSIYNTDLRGNIKTSSTGSVEGIWAFGYGKLSLSGVHLNRDILPYGYDLIYMENCYFSDRFFMYIELPVNSLYKETRVQIKSGSTISLEGTTIGNASATGHSMQGLFMVTGTTSSGGVFTADTNSFTLINASGVASQVYGIGTWINVNGSHDFAAIYKVNNATGTGANTLYTGLTTTAQKYLVHDISLSASTASSLPALSGRQCSIMTAAGDRICGGTFSLPEGATVTTILGKDLNGAADISASTVNISGASVTLGGVFAIRGTIVLSGGVFTTSSVDIRGEGNSAVLDLAQHNFNNVGNYTFSNLTIKNGRAASDVGTTYGGCIKADDRTIIIRGCTVRDCYSASAIEGAMRLTRCATTITNCTFSGNNGTDIGINYGATATAAATITGCKLLSTSGKSLYIAGAKVAISGTTLSNGIWWMETSNAIIQLSGTVTIRGTIAKRSTGSGGTLTINVDEGTTISLYGNNNATITPGTSVTTIVVAGGDSSKTCTIIDVNNNPRPVNGGTYHAINNNGTMT